MELLKIKRWLLCRIQLRVSTVVCLTLTGLLTGCSPSLPPVAIGETVQTGTWEIRVDWVNKIEGWHYTEERVSYYYKPIRGMVLLQIGISVKNIGNEKDELFGTGADVMDSQGREGEIPIDLAWNVPLILTLAPGQDGFLRIPIEVYEDSQDMVFKLKGAKVKIGDVSDYIERFEELGVEKPSSEEPSVEDPSIEVQVGSEPTPATFEPIVMTGSYGMVTGNAFVPITVTTNSWVINWTYTLLDRKSWFNFSVLRKWEGAIPLLRMSPKDTDGSYLVDFGMGEYFIKVGSYRVNWEIVISPIRENSEDEDGHTERWEPRVYVESKHSYPVSLETKSFVEEDKGD